MNTSFPVYQGVLLVIGSVWLFRHYAASRRSATRYVGHAPRSIVRDGVTIRLRRLEDPDDAHKFMIEVSARLPGAAVPRAPLIVTHDGRVAANVHEPMARVDVERAIELVANAASARAEAA